MHTVNGIGTPSTGILKTVSSVRLYVLKERDRESARARSRFQTCYQVRMDKDTLNHTRTCTYLIIVFYDCDDSHEPSPSY